jgi:NADP-dependent 3-hydroxy acid dehydrogenase YdfG
MTDAPVDPLSLFSVKGKVAIVTGASGAFGAVAAETLASAGARLVLAAGKVKELAAVADACRKRGTEVEAIASTRACAAIPRESVGARAAASSCAASAS